MAKIKTPPYPVLVQDTGQEVLDPNTGFPVVSPIMRFAILHGHWYTNSKGMTRPEWAPITKMVMPHWEIPRYFGFDEEERNLYYKLCSEAFLPVRSIGYLLGFVTPSAGVAFVIEKCIPLYKIDKVLYVFSGDIVRAVNSCRVDYDDPVVRGALGNQMRRWNRRAKQDQPRGTPLRREGAIARFQGDKPKPDREDPPAGRGPSTVGKRDDRANLRGKGGGDR